MLGRLVDAGVERAVRGRENASDTRRPGWWSRWEPLRPAKTQVAKQLRRQGPGWWRVDKGSTAASITACWGLRSPHEATCRSIASSSPPQGRTRMHSLASNRYSLHPVLPSLDTRRHAPEPGDGHGMITCSRHPRPRAGAPPTSLRGCDDRVWALLTARHLRSTTDFAGRSFRAFAHGYVAIVSPLHLVTPGFEALTVGASRLHAARFRAPDVAPGDARTPGPTASAFLEPGS